MPKKTDNTTKKLIQKITISKPIGNLYRPAHAQILVKQGEYFVLGKKSDFYPSGFARMLGGGINPSEMPDLGATREILEETGLQISSNNLIKIATVITKAKITNSKITKTKVKNSDVLKSQLKKENVDKMVDNQLKKSKNDYKILKTVNHIYYLEIDKSIELKAGDDISELAYYTEKEFVDLLNFMQNMTGTYTSPKFSFEWRDYEKMYYFHHFLALKFASKICLIP